MSDDLFTLEEIVSILREECIRLGNQSRVADQLGVSKQYLSQVLSGAAKPGRKIIAGLGLRKVTRYEIVPRS